jgi:hypothetical protein
MKKKIYLALAALALASAPAHAQWGLVNNGGFETGNLSGWTTANENADGVSPIGFDGYAPHSGNYFLAFGNVGSDFDLSQTITDTPGATYVLSYWLSGNGSLPSDFSANWDGTQLSHLNPVPEQGYTEFTFDVTGTGSDTLLFGLRDDPSYGALDDISLFPAGVPDGGTTASLLSLGLVGLGALRRKLA